jgi:hypothetical protein
MRLTSLTLLAFLAACGGEAPNSAIVRDSAGVRIVENTDPLWQAGEAWRFSAEPLVDIGGGDTEDDQLYRVVGALRLDDGRIVVANGGSYELRFFDPDGRFLSASGRQGGGPGEFQFLTWLGRAGADSLVAYDPRARRLSLFDMAGTYGGSLTLVPVPAGGRDAVAAANWAPRPRGWFAGGGYVATQIASRFSPGEEVSRPDELLFRFTPDGHLADTLGVFPGGELSMQTAGSQEPGRPGLVFIAPPHFGHTTTYAVHGDRFFVATGDRYEVLLYSSGGTLESVVRRAQEPIPVTQREVDQLLEARRAAAPPVQPGMPAPPSLESRPASSTIPAFQSIAVDDVANLWVEEYEWPPGRPPTWTVFDADGRLLGSVAFPDHFTPYHIGDDFVLGRWQDELDVEHVLLYELIKPEG